MVVMASPSSSTSKPPFFVSAIVLMILMLTFTPALTTSCLSSNYYKKTCPNVFKVVEPVVRKAIAKEPRMGASILRLFYHDCFVNGCDGSLLLDDTPTFIGEKTARPNNNSARGFEVIDDIKTALEKECPGVVSCADALAIASRDSVAILGGPTWTLKLGRLDARTASRSLATRSLPPPISNLTNLVQSFTNNSLKLKDVVVLSGAHTIGLARCTTFRRRIYNDSGIDSAFRALRQKTCPATSGSGDNNLAPLDLKTPNLFNNDYYKNLVKQKGLLHSDQVLFNCSAADSLVLKYSRDERAFFKDFATSMIRMGNIQPGADTPREVRKNCRRVN